MTLVRIDDDLAVNPEHVVSVQRNGSHGTKIYVAGSDAPHSTREGIASVLDRLAGRSPWGRR